MREFDELIQKKGLPRVGHSVLSKDLGTLWRVMHKSEVWLPITDEPEPGEPRRFLRFS